MSFVPEESSYEVGFEPGPAFDFLIHHLSEVTVVRIPSDLDSFTETARVVEGSLGVKTRRLPLGTWFQKGAVVFDRFHKMALRSGPDPLLFALGGLTIAGGCAIVLQLLFR